MDWLARLKRFYFALPSRPARPASLARNLAKTLAQSVVMWLAFLVVLPMALLQIENWLLLHGWPFPRFAPVRVLAVALFVSGWAVAWMSAWALVRWGRGTPLPVDATNQLVIRGPYRYIRNPMASASLLQGAGIGMWLGSPLILVYIIAGGVIWNYAVRPWEEADLHARFGADYRRYQQRVRCWIPRWTGYDQDRAGLEGTSGV